MDSLFPELEYYPQGFKYWPDFISKSEEEELLNLISKITLHSFNFQGYEAKRLVASFGYDYNFTDRTITPGSPIPDDFKPVVTKVAKFLNIKESEFVELLVTKYPPGAVINWHRDAPPFDLIAGLSLSSDCIFRLRPHDKTKQTRSGKIQVNVLRRSLYILSGQSRSDWQHSISPVTNTRFSITLRTLKKRA